MLALVGSFYFSGTETGFYRVSRSRLVLESTQGNRKSRFLLWLVNHPSFFIATALVGNNVSNYFVSLGVVLMCQELGDSAVLALISTVVSTPVVFIYGELLPKSIFLHVPYRMMHLLGPLYVFLLPLCFPVSILLWMINYVISYVMGHSTERYSMRLAQRELRRILEEGEDLGLVKRTQQNLADGVFNYAGLSASEWIVPIRRVPRVSISSTQDEAIRTARFAGVNELLVMDSGNVVGYYYLPEMLLHSEQTRPTLHSLVDITPSMTLAAVLPLLHSQRIPWAVLRTESGYASGVVYERELRALFLGEV